LKTYHLHIEGRVQGVGFRPFIYGLAKKYSLKGTVANTLEGVHIYVNCGEKKAAQFMEQIRKDAPKQSQITSIRNEEVPTRQFQEFSIIESTTKGAPDLLITPDFAICDQCIEELFDPKNKRYRYPYITCTECGPRFSIATDLPYDRQRTSMEMFNMCDECQREYLDPTDRRFYSQTNTCPDCAVNQWMVDMTGEISDLSQQEIVDFICDKIDEGEIVTVKGIGGFLLMCDASNEACIRDLRHKKDRPSKPFALMYPDAESVQKNFIISEGELAELQSTHASIALLTLKPASRHKKLLKLHAPGLDRLGVMLPYTPLFLLILKKLSKPLLATSGNMHGSPITYQNEKAQEALSLFSSHFLMNNRDIQIPQDDSVVKFSRKHDQKIIIRRSRGYAPGFLQSGVEADFDGKVLAMGALLKSTFTIWQNGRCHVSQFLGDTTELDAQVSYERTLRHFFKLLHFKPEVLLVDKHPAYFSTHLGKELANDLEADSFSIQHHEAHIWAVLGEHNLLHSKEKVLGVVLDGTGMGHDGAIWGSEFFVYNGGKLKRTNHLKYYAHILGDKMAREPRLSALSILHESNCPHKLDVDAFDDEELDFYTRVLDHASLQTSSMGRLFDAVSSLLGLCQKNTYEGEAAMYLEQIAQKYCDDLGIFPEGYDFEILPSGYIDMCSAIQQLLDDLHKGEQKGCIAAKFHRSVVNVIAEIISLNQVRHVAFSGGVMQNGLLVDMIIDQLGDQCKLYFHRELSPNDECISYGQLVGYYVSSKVEKSKKNKFKSKIIS
jgi:hydrogenase maturation protein HypF